MLVHNNGDFYWRTNAYGLRSVSKVKSDQLANLQKEAESKRLDVEKRLA